MLFLLSPAKTLAFDVCSVSALRAFAADGYALAAAVSMPDRLVFHRAALPK